MTVLEWDKSGEKKYQAGVDRGVLYLKDGRSAVWNGLVSVEDTSNSELKSFYLDGVKFLDQIIPGDFSGKLSAFTYPDEFDLVNGVLSTTPGLSYYNQPSKSFNLSYRTRIGNDIDGINYGYKIHLLYNVVANPDNILLETGSDQSSASPFGWTLSGTPSRLSGRRPTAHISIDSNDASPEVLGVIEDILYGTSNNAPRIPSIDEIQSIFESVGNLLVFDNGDGTWTAVDVGNDYITMIDDTTFRITADSAVYLDSVTYRIGDSILVPPDPTVLYQLMMRSSGALGWSITVDNDGYINVITADPDGPLLDEELIKDSDGVVWAITATDDGTLDVTISGAGDTSLTQLKMRAPDGGVWVITVTTDGTLNIAAL